jgi:hypothetical protein
MSENGATFAEMVDTAADAKGLNDYQMSAAIGLMPGNRVCSPKQVRRIREGAQVNYHRDLIERLIDVLDLDPADAWERAGVWPPGLTADELRDLESHRVGTGRDRRSDRQITTDTAATPAAVRVEDVEPRDSTPALNGAAA